MKTYLSYAAIAVLLLTVPALAGDILPNRTNHVPLTPQERAATGDVAAQVEAIGHLGNVALRAGDFVSAETDFRQAISVGGGIGSTTSYYGLAQALTGQGRMDEAISAYRQVISSDWTEGGGGQADTRALNNYALLLNQAGQWKEAVARLKQALSSLPDGDILKANTNFDPDMPQPAALTAAAHIALGIDASTTPDDRNVIDNNRAMREFDKAHRSQPDSPLTNYYYGKGLENMGRDAEAKAAFQKAAKVGRGAVKLAAQKALKHPKKPA